MNKINYRRYYFLIVITIILVTVASQLIIRTSLERQTNDGNKISIAGFQTALSTEIAKLSLSHNLLESNNESTKETDMDLKKALQKLENRHLALIYGNKYELSGENSERANAILLESKAVLDKMSELSSLLINTRSDKDSEILGDVVRLSDEYSEKMKEVVYEFKLANTEKIQNLKLLELILAAFMIGILLLEIFIVIKPALNKLRKRNDQLLESNKKLKELNQVKSDFLANISHEIRTPLNGVIGMSHLLSLTQLNEDQHESVETIHTSAQNLLEILNDVLDFSKLESGKQGIDSTEFSLAELIDEVVELLAPVALKKGVHVMTDLDPSVPEMVISDEGKVRQILVNLISNAIKFTDVGEVVIHVKAGESEEGFVELEFSVSDTGIGIAEDKLSTIFDSFTQADNSTTRKYGGTGLGLSISSQLVKLLHGKIWVESQLGKGSTFSFTIVVEHTDSLSAITNQVSEFIGKRALVLDDNKTNLKILVKMLSNWGITATPFNSPDLVLSILEKLENFDICILDMQMPEIDGIHIAQKIRQKYSREQLPIILLSSMPESEHEAHYTPDYNIFLNKPIKQKRLLSALAQLISEKEHLSPNTPSKRKKPDTLSHNSDLKVLIAEDNAINKAVAIKSLEILGISPELAEDGKVVLEKLRTEIYDLILMDIQMPNLDGFETTTHIRKNLSQNDQPVIIAMTAASANSDKVKYTTKGMDDFIPKPLDIDELSHKINTWFPDN